MKCLCPPPDYITVPLPHGMTETIIVDWPGVEWLYGKKADRECVRCGQPLCSDCEDYLQMGDTLRSAPLCSICTEWIKKQWDDLSCAEVR